MPHGMIETLHGVDFLFTEHSVTVCAHDSSSCIQVYTPDKLNDLMAESDYVVAALPHTDQTEKLVSAEAISHMKKTGVFINIGRGQTVDEVALVKGECLLCMLTTLT